MLLNTGCDGWSQAKVLREVPWSATGEWLIIDTHTHTRFSDGKRSVDELVKRTIVNGCNALAITDHGDLSADAATTAYFEAIRNARERYPRLILVAGIEWNIPPYGQREHVTVLVDPEPVLSKFKQQFEMSDATSKAALEWLAEQVKKKDGEAVLIYNHPSRKDANIEENAADLVHWRDVNDLFIGFEGAPGHQKANPPGLYKYLQTQDRWDPVVAEVGGVWDAFLDWGQDIWAALAVSDFHKLGWDYWPCEFARTHIQVPERSTRGVLQALRAGSFWADHGQVLADFGVFLSAPGLPASAKPGEVVRVRPHQTVQITIVMQRDRGSRDEPLEVELIGNGRTGKPEVLSAQIVPSTESIVSWSFDELQPGADGKSCYFRVRVRRSVPNGPDLLAYSNSIRVVIR